MQDEHPLSKEQLEQYMQAALEEASRAEQLGEVPVGAVVELAGKIIGRGHNRPVSACDPTAHAEVMALREAARSVVNYRLAGARLFVTIEPCPMCVGACLHARIHSLVFGARDPKTGAVRSRYRMLDDPHHNHEILVTEGVLQERCGQMLTDFFRRRREAIKGGKE